MLGRLLLGGVAWLIALLLFAALLQWSGSQPPRVTPALDGVKSATFLREMVVTVAAERPDRARTIAEQIVLPVRQHYEEILVYVQAVDTKSDPLVRRIDWTPRAGFQEMGFR